MAKTQGSLFSLNAHGSIAKTLTYSKRKSGQQARSYNKPLKDPSAKQRGQRRLTEFLVAQWQNMSGVDKATWDARATASGLNLAGYHYFLREAQRDLYTHHGLGGYWHCNEIVAGYVKDISGNDNHGLLYPDWPTNAPILVSSKTSKFGKALEYDGVDEYVDCGGGPTLAFDASEAFTISLMVYVPTLELSTLIRKALYLNYGYYFKLSSVGKLRLQDDRAVSAHMQESNDALLAETWYELCFVYNSGVFIPFINGVQSTITTTGTPAFTDTATYQLTINDSDIGSNLAVTIDEVCYYNRALSAAEIATRFQFSQRKVK